MFINFFLELRQGKLPVSLREYLTFIEAMRAHENGEAYDALMEYGQGLFGTTDEAAG